MISIASIILTISGLALFETVSSIDNAIINAEVIDTMSKKARRWFLTYGIILSVFVVRGALPWLIVWLSTPGIGPVHAFTASFSGDERVMQAVENSAPMLLLGGGIFLLFLFLHWLFIEPKQYGLAGERFFSKQGVWFFALASIILAGIVWLSLPISPFLAFGAVMGSTAFFITHGFKQNAEQTEQSLMKSSLSDISKILFLEIIDSTFSIDGVLGAFAFTLSVPLILAGNGVGAIIVRWLTVSNIDQVKKYAFLKNGAMYSIFCLGFIMTLDAFGVHIPSYASPITTFVIIGYFLLKSIRNLKKEASA